MTKINNNKKNQKNEDSVNYYQNVGPNKHLQIFSIKKLMNNLDLMHKIGIVYLIFDVLIIFI